MSEAKQILEDIIKNFEAEKFIKFFRGKNRNFTPRQEKIEGGADFSDGKKLGEIKFLDGNLIIAAFKVKSPLSERTGKKAQYELGKKILKETLNDVGIFIFYDQTGNFRFSLIYANYLGQKREWSVFRRFTYFVSAELTNKTFLKQMEKENAFSTLDFIKEAFSLSAVTDIFYKEFFVEYNKIVETVKNVNKITEQEKARDFVLLFAIRTVFLGFIQKKGWIGDDEKFIQNFFAEYENKYFGKDEFYRRWMAPLFFEALNSAPGRKVAYGNNNFSREIEEKLQMAPFLNGGLFKEKAGYDNHGWNIPDKEIKNFFDFLFSHSFTIEENSLEDEDLQLNPEFLGIIFERLVNKADGAVYTPRTEVDLMCRLSLVKWLQKNLNSSIRLENLYELFFREGKDEQDQKDGSFSPKEINEILGLLDGLAVCDPACGSGAFLVGMAQVLDEIESKLRKKINGQNINIFERKKSIIAKSLYGVEAKEWAVWICQLRLWLSLFIDAPQEFKNSASPILPSLDFKVRQGDSLVQKVGSKLFPVSGHIKIQNKTIRDKITKLKNLKIEYFDNKTELKDWELKQRESAIYEEILNYEISEKENEWRNLKNIKPTKAISLFGDEDNRGQTSLELNQQKVEELEKEIAELKEQKSVLKKDKPLVWGIEFAEIFAEKGGFDIIIGNPPYVRQEAIADPMGKIKDKKEYKNLLAEMVKLDFPDDFPPKAKINAQSDLYVYFYIRGLRLLNPQGIHTFICSNSWLDVGYGVWLQKFLLERAPLECVIDNHAKRSFEAADVNTIISIIHAPILGKKKQITENHLVKFIAFKKPFEETVFTEFLLQIENTKEIISNDIFRAYPITIYDLKEAGMEYEGEGERKLGGGKYAGDKWGGKYLRAPQFLLSILNSPKVRPFNKCVEIKYGVKPGNVKFFYLDKNKAEQYKIERDFLFPAIISSQHLNKIYALPTHFIFYCAKSKSELKGTGAIDYIKWGEINNMDKGVSVESHRPYWYSLSCEDINTVFFQFWDKRFFTPIASEKMSCSNNFCYGIFKENEWGGKLAVNSTFYFLQIALFGCSNQGQGVLTTYMEYDYPFIRLPILKKEPQLYKGILEKLNKRAVEDVFIECGIDPKSETPIEAQEPHPLPDRAELDKIIFDALDLTSDERKQVYRAVCRLVWNRISKARSV